MTVKATYDAHTEANEHWDASLAVALRVVKLTGLSFWIGAVDVMIEFKERHQAAGSGNAMHMEFRRQITNEGIEYLRDCGEWY